MAPPPLRAMAGISAFQEEIASSIRAPVFSARARSAGVSALSTSRAARQTTGPPLKVAPAKANRLERYEAESKAAAGLAEAKAAAPKKTEKKAAEPVAEAKAEEAPVADAAE